MFFFRRKQRQIEMQEMAEQRQAEERLATIRSQYGQPPRQS